jgi:hypothetical protein
MSGAALQLAGQSITNRICHSSCVQLGRFTSRAWTAQRALSLNPFDDAESADDGVEYTRDILATLIAIAGIAGIGGLSLLTIFGCAAAAVFLATSLILHLH